MGDPAEFQLLNKPLSAKKRTDPACRTISSFFSKKPKHSFVAAAAAPEGLTNDDKNASSPTLLLLNFNKDKCIDVQPVSNCTSRPTTSLAENPNEMVETIKSQSEFSSDIGFYVGVNSLDDHTKVTLLEKPWTPPPNYQFPYNELTKKGKLTKKYAQRSHLDKFHWLVISHKDKGLYCKYCVLFPTGLGKINHNVTPLRKLAKEPLKKFDNLMGEKGDLNVHERNPHHKSAVQNGKHFLLSYRQPSLEVKNQVNAQRNAQVEENKQRLLPIVKTIIFCGRQNIPLRGHRDDGSINLSEENGPVHNDGNFKELLRFRVDAGDNSLRKHLECAKNNATYISKSTQNQIIDCCKSEIQSAILKRVKDAGVFSILFDETTDISNICQLSLSFRYVHKSKNKSTLREDFVTFANAYKLIRPEDVNKQSNESRLTGIALGHIVEDLAKMFDLDLQFCVGFGTDSCSVMASEAKGAVQELKKKAPHAQRCPCHNHILNNALASSSKVAACRNSSGTMKKIVSFLKSSPKRHCLVLEKNNFSLQSICDTRWVERHDGYLQFQGESILGIHDVLEEMTSWEDRKTAADAFSLLQSIRSPEFLISVTSLSDILGVTVSLSRLLQTPTLDLHKATNAFQDTLCVLQDKRKRVDEVFNNLYKEVKEIADKLDVDLKMPRVVGRQTQRQNLPAESSEEFFKKSIYIPLLDYVLTDLNERLSQDVLNLFSLRVILPNASQSSEERIGIEKVVKFYWDLLGKPNLTAVMQESLLWRQLWKRRLEEGGELPSTLMEALDSCDIEMYPTIAKLLKILATLPVSAATAERSFSTLRRLKTWLRANMGEERLAGLALLNVHRDISIDPESIIVRFAKKKRRQEFVLSSASELISRRGVFSRRQYGSVEQIPQTPEGGAAADQSCRRFRLENGESIGEKDEMFGSPAAPVLENPEFQTRWYFKYFLGKLHQNYVGLDATKEPFLVSVVQTTGGPVRAILFNKMGTQKISLPPSAWGGANLSSSNAMGTTSSTRPAVKNILQHFPGMEKLEKGPREVMCPEIQKDILLLEEQEGSVNFKFGVILMKDGQVVDDEMLSNEFGSEHWDRFLNLLGERIRLRGWRRFRGGLDVKGDMTGSHAVYTMHQGHEIMFHVSTMLPFSKDNKQQVERKRHIGNDIVNVIFVESGAHENFNPQCIKSHFTHVFAVVSPVVNNSSTSYRLSVFCDQAVPPFGPSLPCPSIFSDPQLFREFLLVKLMNGEKATFQTPTFALKRQRTLNTLIRDLYQEHGGEHKMPMLSRRALSDVWASGGSGGPGGGGGGDARTERFLRTGQALKLDAVLRGDAPTSLASAPGFGYLRRVPWEAQALGVLPPPGSIICADSWGDQRLIMATTSGVYMVEEGSPLKQLLPRWDIPVRQLQLCESHGLMLLRAGCAAASGRLYALRLASLAAGAYRNLTRVDAKPLRVDKTKGCHLFAVSKPGVSHVRVAVACGRRVVLLQARRSAAWATWCAANVTPALIPAGAPSSETALENDDAADDFAIIKDFQLTELPFLMSIVEGHSRDADLICIGYKQHWELLSQTTGQPLKWSTSSCPHGHSSASAESSGGRGALVAALQLTDDKDTQLLLCYNHTCHFQRLTDTGLEDSNEFDFHWTTVPIAVVCSFPYVMAFAEDLLEIRLVANGSLVHATNLPGLKLLSSKKDIFYTANAPEYVPIARDLERGSFSIETVTNSPSKTINKQLTLLSREGNDCLERDASIDTKQGDCVSSSSRSSSVSSEHDPLKSLMKKGQSASPPSSPHNSTSDYTNPKNLRERIYRICSGSFSANSINQRQSSSADPVSHPIPTNECNETVVKSDTDADAATEGPAARSTNGCPSTTGPNKSSTFSATKRCPSIPTANIHDQ